MEILLENFLILQEILGGCKLMGLKMDLNRIEKIKIKFFEYLLTEHKQGYKIVGYGNKNTQEIRFRVLTEIADLNDKTVLDIGCGLGHLVDFLDKNDIKVEYTGFDIIEKFLESARRIYPNRRFETWNIMKRLPREKFDYVLACGVLNVRIGCNEEYLKNFIERIFKICKHGVAINMLSTHADYRDPECYYYSPEKVLAWVLKKISRSVVLRQDYLPHDFTLYIYKKSFDEKGS